MYHLRKVLLPSTIKYSRRHYSDDLAFGVLAYLLCAGHRSYAEYYPASFRGSDGGKLYAHKDDYKITSSPIKPEVFLYLGKKGSRLFCRSSFKLSNGINDNRYTSATFLLDSSTSHHFDVCPELHKLLRDRICSDELGRFIATEIGGVKHRCIVRQEHPLNIMGLPMFLAMSLSFNKGPLSNLVLDKEFVAHDAASFTEFKCF